ncbi:beta-fructofuranosidase, soluble isoenzyme I-like isoform X1 [Malania oleifera]|uniref:beta-fructofuranosidase, soluble isoenzyme I-like isoform X1 n=1 Tax=Malania oleifera TaxID=397392 RepID=UPI0025AE4EB8|nr:beta-fructofuranosidase, soluble isoenzyme I-like isoform X1 [Malania oleifera]
MDQERAASYTPLRDSPQPAIPPADHCGRRPTKVLTLTILSTIFLVSLLAFIRTQGPRPPTPTTPSTPAEASRGAAQGVSEKNFQVASCDGRQPRFNWSNAMYSWQRTAYHFQPEKNWMNGPLYHMGWYHLFYQYNPDSAVWGNITWGHAVSRDMIHWLYLPFAMVPDHWFDWNGVWSGSATLLPDGGIVMLYTGDTDNYVQVQNLAYPANISDPLLLDWVKYPGNPVMVPPPGIAPKDFRDPTTAWVAPDGNWRVTIGSKVNKTGFSFVFQTTNFTSFQLLDGVLHAVPGTGMWECVDFYPVSTTSSNGLDTSANSPGVKHVLKASLDDTKEDHYALGTYDPVADKWTPDNPKMDVGIGLRVDYGRYYASKTFYDQKKGRRIMWGWMKETDVESDDVAKGWASVQTLPRVVGFDNKTKTNILQWPAEEVEKLRLNQTNFSNVELLPGSVVPLDVGQAAQLDIEAEFEVDKETLKGLEGGGEVEVGYDCVVGGGATGRGTLGPFGLIVLATDSLSELTPVYFYISRAANGNLTTFFCADESRSSKATDVDKRIYGSVVPVLDGVKFSMRLLVDHSIVESFAEGGRTCVTSRIYPTEAIFGATRAFLFNNATTATVTASLKIWEMDSAFIRPFPLHQ